MTIESWHLTDHICRNCFGRILVRYKSRKIKRVENRQLELFSESSTKQETGNGSEIVYRETGKVFRCADCGQRAFSNDVEDICCCGLMLKDGTDLGIRCVHSDDPNEPYQTEIVAKQVDG